MADRAGSSAYVNVLGAHVGQQCLQPDLLDEMLIFFAPVILGGGTRMFGPSGRARIEVEPTIDETVHWYRVRR